MLELTFATKEMLGKGRNFDCAVCPARTQNLRKCNTDRWDYEPADNPSVFPIRLFEGGQEYGFCPSKATWPGPASMVNRFKELIVAASQQTMLVSGGIRQQPSWFIETLSWFKPMYDQVIFMARMRSALGSGKMKRAVGKKPSRGNANGNRGLRR